MKAKALFPLTSFRRNTHTLSLSQTHMWYPCRIIVHSDFCSCNRLKILLSKLYKEKTPTVVFRISLQLICLPSPVTRTAAPDGGEHMVLLWIVLLSLLWNPTPSHRMCLAEQMVSVAIQLFSTALFLPMEPSLLNNKMKRQLQVFTGPGLVRSFGVNDNLLLLTIPAPRTPRKEDFPLHIPDLPGSITVNQLPVIFLPVIFYLLKKTWVFSSSSSFFPF